MPAELWPHQEKAVNDLHNGAVLWGLVGTGKSRVAMAYYMRNEAPKDIYVFTTAKKRESLDWEGEAARFGVGTEKGRTTAGTITVDSWNNIKKYTYLEDCFVIFDENRLVGSGAWAKAFQKIAKKNRWIILTGTPGDTWLDYAQLFIANGLYKNLTQYKREHVVYAPFSRYPKVIRYLGVRTLEKHRNLLLVEMPFFKHTNRIMNDIELGYDKDLYLRAFKDRWHVYEDRPITNVAELFFILRRIVNSDPSRLDAIRALMMRHDKIIIFYSFNYELEILRTLGDEITVAEWNGHRKQPLPKTDKYVYLVQYVSGAEGWNCIDTDAMVFWSMTYSYKNFEQAQGRIDRLNTPFTDLYYYVLLSDSAIDKAVRDSLKHKRTFNELAWAAKTLGIDTSDPLRNG